jgi:hypothetical protein
MSNVTYTIEGLVDGTWCREHVGANESNLFDSREAAEAELPSLARVLECDVSDLRVVEFAGITVELNTAKGPRVEYGRGDDEAAVEAAMANVADINISDELRAGIAAYELRIAPLLGRVVTVRTPDGLEHTGTFGEAAKCQPIVTQADGRRFAVSVAELDRLTAEVAS